jgi:hypothetical protein
VGILTEESFEALLTAGCPCGARKIAFRMYVDGLVPLQGGEPVGPVKWSYDGEKFVDGVYDARCAACERVLFEAAVCPRCHADGALGAALETENRWPVPEACPRCGLEEIRYIAFIPARTSWEGKRADKARTTVEIGDPGFHGYRVDCRDCGKVMEIVDRCPICQTPGPLRPRP